MTDIEGITSHLARDDRGVWVSKMQTGISYPDEGNALIFPAEDRLFWFQHRNRCITSLVRRFSANSTLFDIGGGNGVVSQSLHNAGIDVVLLEPGETGVENALGRGIPSIIWATLEDANFRPGSIPSVGMFDVLEHIDDDQGMLEEVNRLLISGGMLYLTVPAYQFLWSHEDEYAEHFRRYSLNGLREVLMKAGFYIQYATYIFSLLPPFSFLTRTLPYRLNLDRWLSVDREKAVQLDLGILGKTVELILRPEVEAIRRGIVLPAGGSCLIAASRKD